MKIPKVVAGYIPSALNSPTGTHCGACRDFISSTCECRVVPGPISSAFGTCTLFVLGQPHLTATREGNMPRSVAGYIEGPEVPTYCGRCRYYADPHHGSSECSRVGDHPHDTVQFGGCCNAYEATTAT